MEVIYSGLSERGYEIEEISYKNRIIKAVSPPIDRNLLWFIP